MVQNNEDKISTPTSSGRRSWVAYKETLFYYTCVVATQMLLFLRL